MNEKIIKQLNNGMKPNSIITEFKQSRPCPFSPRAKQILYAMRTGNAIPAPEKRTDKADEVNQYGNTRQMRYFGAFAIDQWEHAFAELRRSGLDVSVAKTYKDEFISYLHDDFTTGRAYDYTQDWYKSFPQGGFFNPIRYKNLYSDENGIAYRISQYLQCGEFSPVVSGLLSYAKPNDFNYALVPKGGLFLVTYPDEVPMRDLLLSEIDTIDDTVAETIGEEEGHTGQRIFITDAVDNSDGTHSCGVVYGDFEDTTLTMLNNSVKNAILETIPTNYFKDSRLRVETRPFRITVGEWDMAKQHLAYSGPQHTFQTQKNSGGNVLNDGLSPSEHRDRALYQPDNYGFR